MAIEFINLNEIREKFKEIFSDLEWNKYDDEYLTAKLTPEQLKQVLEYEYQNRTNRTDREQNID